MSENYLRGKALDDLMTYVKTYHLSKYTTPTSIHDRRVQYRSTRTHLVVVKNRKISFKIEYCFSLDHQFLVPSFPFELFSDSSLS